MLAPEAPQPDVTRHARLHREKVRIERVPEGREPPGLLHELDIGGCRRGGERRHIRRGRHARELAVPGVQQHRSRRVAAQPDGVRVPDAVNGCERTVINSVDFT